MTDLTPAAERARPVLVNLQALRFAAAALVLCHHLLQALSRLSGDPWGEALARRFAWMAGVDVFFVISGFIMVYTAGSQPAGFASARTFLIRRLVRVAPLYWLFTLLMAAVTLAASVHLRRNQVDPAHLIASLAFYPWLRPGDANPAPVLLLGWTLNYEMLFYALFSASLLLPRRLRLAALALAIVALAASHRSLGRSSVQAHFWTYTLILEFLLGAALAALAPHMRRGRLWLGCTAAGALLLALVGHTHGWRWLLYGGPAALICAGCAFAPSLPQGRPATRWLSLLGDSSYALYLSHPFFLGVLGLGFQHLRLHAPVAFLVAGLLGAIAVGVGVHLAVERPLAARLRRLMKPQPSRQQPQPP